MDQVYKQQEQKQNKGTVDSVLEQYTTTHSSHYTKVCRVHCTRKPGSQGSGTHQRDATNFHPPNKRKLQKLTSIIILVVVLQSGRLEAVFPRCLLSPVYLFDVQLPTGSLYTLYITPNIQILDTDRKMDNRRVVLQILYLVIGVGVKFKYQRY